jgi:hypothetical protein
VTASGSEDVQSVGRKCRSQSETEDRIYIPAQARFCLFVVLRKRCANQPELSVKVAIEV